MQGGQQTACFPCVVADMLTPPNAGVAFVNLLRETQSCRTRAAVQLPYLEAVLQESMRLYPSVSMTLRYASEDLDLARNGIVVPK